MRDRQRKKKTDSFKVILPRFLSGELTRASTMKLAFLLSPEWKPVRLSRLNGS